MIFVFFILAVIAVFVIGYAFTHPVRAVVSISKYLCILLGLILLFFTVTVGTESGTAWLAVGSILTIGAFYAANRLSALRNGL